MATVDLAELVEFAQKKEVYVIVDNDCVVAYNQADGESMYEFNRRGPKFALVEVLTLLGMKAEIA